MTDDRNEASEDEALEQVIERAKRDPAFFHNLVFDPERAMSDQPGLDRATRSRLIGINPDELVSGFLGIRHCSDTCGDLSCERTCGMRTCRLTCASSCSAATCASSCGRTTAVVAG
jgi:hypothetical protein